MAERKIAIVGWSQSSRDEAPWDDESWEIWACNQMGLRLPERRYTRWYELHPLETLRNKGLGKDLDWQREQPEPCYMQAKFLPDFPNSVAFPFEEIHEWSKGVTDLLGDRKYVTSTISWQILHALYEHATSGIVKGTYEAPSWGGLHLSLFGVDLAMATEYAHQRPCTEFYLGLAAGLGVNVFVHPASSLLHAPYLYGLEDEVGDTDVLTPQVVADIRTEMQQRYEESTLNAARYDGAKMACQRFLNLHVQARRDLGLPAALELPVPKIKEDEGHPPSKAKEDEDIPRAAERH